MVARQTAAVFLAATLIAALGGLVVLQERTRVTPAPVAATVEPTAIPTGVPTSFEPEPTPEPEPDPLPTSPETRAAFEERYPEQAQAASDDAGGWALLIGINEHLGAVADNYVSREDAELLRQMLLASGWDDERILLLTDTDATGAMIREGLSWLARKSGEDATVLLHYSGHSKKWYGAAGEILDIALRPTDDDFIRRDELAASLDVLEHDRLWGNFATCNAEGFHEAGLARDGRVLTYASRTAEKSYEDPEAGYSVWGRFLLDGVMRPAVLPPQGRAFASPDPSVQEAFEAAAPLAQHRTSKQRSGPQTPVMYDDLGEPFDLALPDGPAAGQPQLSSAAP